MIHRYVAFDDCRIYFLASVWRVFFFFFFSSRRRHTRLQGDWSSDVCSSDLTLSASGDTSLFRSGPFLNSTLDYRLYRRATSRSLLALRLVGVVGNGRGYNEIGRASCRERV